MVGTNKKSKLKPVLKQEQTEYTHRVYAYRKEVDANGQTTGRRQYAWVPEILRPAVDELNENNGRLVLDARGFGHVMAAMKLLDFFKRKGCKVTYPSSWIGTDKEFLYMNPTTVEGKIVWQARSRRQNIR